MGQPFRIRWTPTKPISSWKVARTNARKAAKVECRWHDMRDTFVSSMAEGQASDATIMALAGHVSRKMMERYSHVRGEAKRQAIAELDRRLRGYISSTSPHKTPHSVTNGVRSEVQTA